MRERLEDERAGIIESLVKLNPSFQPADYVRRRPSRKLYIPVKEYPGYNFIGLIIGPRGNLGTHQEIGFCNPGPGAMLLSGAVLRRDIQ